MIANRYAYNRISGFDLLRNVRYQMPSMLNLFSRPRHRQGSARDQGYSRRLWPFFLTILLQACASAPPAEPPLAPLTLPEGFSDSGAVIGPERWWRSFDDPVLNALVQEALDQNFDLAAAHARLRQAQALAVEAGAARIPKLDGSGQAGVERGNDTPTSERYGLGLAAAYEVDLWGRIEAAIEAAEAERRAVAADLQTAAISLTGELTNTYFERVQQEAVGDLLVAQAETNREIAELIRLRFINGQSDIDELLRQRQLVSQSESQLVQTRAQAGLLSQQLAVLTGKPPSTEVPLNQDNDPVLPPLPETGVPAVLLQERPDVMAAFARLQAADAELARAVTAQFPRLNLSANLETAATRPSALFESWLASLMAGVTAPLLDGGALEAQVEQAEAARTQALANYRQTVLESLAEVEAALLAERRDKALLAGIEKQLELARAALDQLTFRYRNGATDYLNVLSTLTSVQALERERLALVYQLIQDRIALYRALAGNLAVESTIP